MSIRDLGLHLVALLVYPGLAMMAVVGLAAEAGVAIALGRASVGAALMVPVAGLRAAARSPRELAVPLLAALAATQLAIPLNPVSAVERNLVVAAIGLVAVTWLLAIRAWTVADARRTLLVQGCWLVALLGPALLSQSLRPQALGAVVLPAAIPLKVAAGILALLCLPALLRLPPWPPPDPAAAVGRLLLWLPLCGLTVSLFVPPSSEDAGGLLRFLAALVATAALAIGLSALAIRLGGRAERLYPRVLAPLAGAVLVIAAVTSALT
jgi:hypothetical protein